LQKQPRGLHLPRDCSEDGRLLEEQIVFFVRAFGQFWHLLCIAELCSLNQGAESAAEDARELPDLY